MENRTGCRSHPQSAERVEELEESVWSVVRRENEHEYISSLQEDSDKSAPVRVRGSDMGVEEGAGKVI